MLRAWSGARGTTIGCRSGRAPSSGIYFVPHRSTRLSQRRRPVTGMPRNRRRRRKRGRRNHRPRPFGVSMWGGSGGQLQLHLSHRPMNRDRGTASVSNISLATKARHSRRRKHLQHGATVQFRRRPLGRHLPPLRLGRRRARSLGRRRAASSSCPRYRRSRQSSWLRRRSCFPARRHRHRRKHRAP